MYFFSVRGMTPTQMEASFHQIECSSMCAFVRFIPFHSCLDSRGQEVANGCGELGSERLCFSYGLRVEAQGQALLSHFESNALLLPTQHFLHILRAECSRNTKFPLQLLEGDSFGFRVDEQNDKKLQGCHCRKEGEGKSP